MKQAIIVSIIFLLMVFPVHAEEEAGPAGDIQVKITRTSPYVDIKVEKGKTLRIQRNQDAENRIKDSFSKTSRKCPPFCIQPRSLGSCVGTIGERQMLPYLNKKGEGDDSILVVDSRGADRVGRGSIPGAVNIHWKKLTLNTAMKRRSQRSSGMSSGCSEPRNSGNSPPPRHWYCSATASGADSL